MFVYRHPKSPIQIPQQQQQQSARPNDKSSRLPRLDNVDSSNMLIKRYNRGVDFEEDVLQEYVVLDRRIIETNQFADGNTRLSKAFYLLL